MPLSTKLKRPKQKGFVFQDLEKKFEQEVERLSRKLKWYAENQQLLDKDSDELREKNLEIKALKEKVEFLESEVCV